MLKTILGLQELREQDLSKSALMRVRFSSVVALIATPVLTVTDHLKNVDGSSPVLSLGLSLLFIICMIPFAYSRIGFILTRPEKRLDEWELRAKRDAESFTYRIVRNIMILLLTIIALFTFGLDKAQLLFSGEKFLYLIGNLLMLTMLLPAAYIAWTKKPLSE